uniref:Uncharacterized protein n=3 Tax=Ditylum brightwellii TaxID=49249 RepID=A0A7S4V8V7_9STRA
MKSDTSKSSLHIPSQPPRYAFLKGMPRADTIMPSQVLSQLRNTHKEVEQTKERIEILRNELRVISDDDNEASGEYSKTEIGVIDMTRSNGTDDATGGNTGDIGIKSKKRRKEKRAGTRSVREVLKSLLFSYPEIIYDPVYAAALRSLNVDVGAVDRERERGCGTLSKKRKTSSSPSSSAKVAELGGGSSLSPLKKKKHAIKATVKVGTGTGVTSERQLSSSNAAQLSAPGSSEDKKLPTEISTADTKSVMDESAATSTMPS